jgi:hypothetical protein
MIKKRVLSLLLAFARILAAAGCASQTQPSNPPQSASTSPSSTNPNQLA